MTAYFPPPRQFAVLLRAALRVIEADNYADDANPHADADSEYAAEKLALAARDLVRAVDKLPEDQQPIGWVEQPQAAPDALAMSDEPVAIEPEHEAEADPFALHRVRVYSHKPGHTPDFWPSHPEDCNALAYGEKCWFDALAEVEADRLDAFTTWPGAGLYLATAPTDGESRIQFAPTTWGQQPQAPTAAVPARDLVQSLGLLDGCTVTPIGFPTPAQIDTNNTKD